MQLCNICFVPLFAHAGLALSVGVGSCINAATLLVILIRRGQYQPIKGWGLWLGRIIIATLAMAAAIAFLQQGIDWAAMQSEWLKRAGLIFLYIGAALVVYFGLLVVMGLRPRHLKPRYDI